MSQKVAKHNNDSTSRFQLCYYKSNRAKQWAIGTGFTPVLFLPTKMGRLVVWCTWSQRNVCWNYSYKVVFAERGKAAQSVFYVQRVITCGRGYGILAWDICLCSSKGGNGMLRATVVRLFRAGRRPPSGCRSCSDGWSKRYQRGA